jgi:predicted aspartyl protease
MITFIKYRRTQSYIRLLLTFATVFGLPVFVGAEPTMNLDSAIKIPMHIRTRQLGYLSLIDAQPVVKVQVGADRHQEKLFFLVDTGCTSIMIDTNTAKGLGLVIGAEDLTAIGAHSQFVTHKADLPWLRLGPIEEHHLPVQTMDLSKADFIGNTDGILGMDFWKKYVLTINYEKNEIELSQFCPLATTKQAWIIPAFNDEQGRLYVTGTINGTHHVRMLLDTCSPTTTIPYELAKEIFAGEIDTKKFSDVDYDVNGGKAKVAKIPTQSFSMGDFACTGLNLYVTKNTGQGSDDCIIGDDFLRNFCVSFDFPRHRLILSK